MSAIKVIEVTLTEKEYGIAVELAEARGMTVSGLLRELLLIYRIEEPRESAAFERIGELIAGIQDESTRNGSDKITMEEIDEEIAAARRERGSFAKAASYITACLA